MLKPKTLVLVFGKHKGVVVNQGRILPKDPDNWVRVEYQDSEKGVRINAFVPTKEVQERNV